MLEGNKWALIPILVFVVLYLGLGILMEYVFEVDMGFYNIPVLFVFLIALAVAYVQTKDVDSAEKFSIMGRGAGDPNVFMMILIFLAAGAFTGIMNRSGAESVANFFLTYIPMEYAVIVIFIVASLVSLSMGTSVGTIAVLTPIAVSISETTDFAIPLCVGAVIGGAMFGDNLSFISDTTIAACNGQGCNMRDKFRINFAMAFPAAVLTVIILFIMTVGSDGGSGVVGDFDLILFIPYIIILAGGILGFNVFLVLAVGISAGAIIMVGTGNTDAMDLMPMIGSGMSGMLETAMVAIMVSAICALIAHNGGFEAILSWIRQKFRGERGGMLGVGLLVSAMDVATANNTVAIVISNPIAKDISEEYGLTPRRTASILDTFSCIMQGIIPYGAQMLIAIATVASLGYTISAFDVMPYLIYPYTLLLSVLLCIAFLPNIRRMRAARARSDQAVPEDAVALAGGAAFGAMVTAGGVHPGVPVTLDLDGLLQPHAGEQRGDVRASGKALPGHGAYKAAPVGGHLLDALGA